MKDSIKFMIELFIENKCRIRYKDIQRLAYEKAKREDHELLKTFSKHYFGMYSSEVYRLLRILHSIGFISCIEIPNDGLRYYLTDDGLFLAIEKGWTVPEYD